MPRSMWRGAIQFGLVTVPVKLYLATEARGGLNFHMLHKTCMNRIQMKVHCPEHGEISRSDTVRGFEYSKGQYIVLDEEDFEKVPLKTVRSIDIELFVDADAEQDHTRFVKQAYYLEPEAIGRKAFYLLKDVLAEEGLTAIAKIVLKDREALAAINPFDTTMLLSTLYWPDEIRDARELDLPAEDYDFKPAEKAVARQLVEAMKGEFEPEQYKDEYREALVSVIEAKAEGKRVEVPTRDEQPTKIADLMSVLEASVAAARDRKTGGGTKTASRSRSSASSKPEKSDKVADIKSGTRKTAAAKTAAAAKAEPKQERRRKTA
jgi:DNA end-binding protein Ku